MEFLKSDATKAIKFCECLWGKPCYLGEYSQGQLSGINAFDCGLYDKETGDKIPFLVSISISTFNRKSDFAYAKIKGLYLSSNFYGGMYSIAKGIRNANMFNEYLIKLSETTCTDYGTTSNGTPLFRVKIYQPLSEDDIYVLLNNLLRRLKNEEKNLSAGNITRAMFDRSKFTLMVVANTLWDML